MKTKAEYERERVKWLKSLGFTRIEGLYAPVDKHAEIKASVRRQYPTPRKRDVE